MAQQNANPFRVVSYDQPVSQYVDPKLGEYSKTLGSLIQTYDKAEQIAEDDGLIMDLMNPGEDASDEEKKYFSQLQQKYSERLDQMAEEGRYEDYLPEVRKMGKELKMIKGSYDNYKKSYSEGLSSIGFNDDGDQIVFDDIRLDQARRSYMQNNKFGYNPNNLMVNQPGSAPSIIADMAIGEELNKKIAEGTFKADGYDIERYDPNTGSFITTSGKHIKGKEAAQLARSFYEDDPELQAFIKEFTQSRSQHAMNNPQVADQHITDLELTRERLLAKKQKAETSEDFTNKEAQQLQSITERLNELNLSDEFIEYKAQELFGDSYEGTPEQLEKTEAFLKANFYGRDMGVQKISNAIGLNTNKWGFKTIGQQIDDTNNSRNSSGKSFGEIRKYTESGSFKLNPSLFLRGGLGELKQSERLLKSRIESLQVKVDQGNADSADKMELLSLVAKENDLSKHIEDYNERLKKAKKDNIFAIPGIVNKNGKVQLNEEDEEDYKELLGSKQRFNYTSAVLSEGTFDKFFSSFSGNLDKSHLERAKKFATSKVKELDAKIKNDSDRDISEFSQEAADKPLLQSKKGFMGVIRIIDNELEKVDNIKEKSIRAGAKDLKFIDIPEGELEDAGNGDFMSVLNTQGSPLSRVESEDSNAEFIMAHGDKNYTINMNDAQPISMAYEKVNNGATVAKNLFRYRVKGSDAEGNEKTFEVLGMPIQNNHRNIITQNISTQYDRLQKATPTKDGQYTAGGELYTKSQYDYVMRYKGFIELLKNGNSLKQITNLKTHLGKGPVGIQSKITFEGINEEEIATLEKRQGNRPYRIVFKDEGFKEYINDWVSKAAFGVDENGEPNDSIREQELINYFRMSTQEQAVGTKNFIEQRMNEYFTQQ